MKKLLLLLCTLLGTAGAWATVTQPTMTTDVNNPNLYRIQSFRSYGFVKYAGDEATLTQTLDFSDVNTKFYFVPVNGTDATDGVKIVSNVNGKQLVEVTSFAEEGTTWYIKENPYKAGFFCISKTSNLSSGCWDCNASGVMSTGYWAPSSSDNDGTSWQILSVDDVPQFETSTLANPKWYYIQSGRNNRWMYANGTTANTTTNNPKTDAYKFAFISKGNNKVQLVSKVGLDAGSNMYISTTPGLSSEESTWYYYNAAQTNGWFNLAIEELEQNDYTQGYFGYLKGSDSWVVRLLHIGNEGNLTKWYGNGVGNNFRVEEVFPTCEVTYTYTYNGKTYSATEIQNIGDPVSLPASITFPYTNYSFSSAVVPDASTATINVTVTGFDLPFTASTDYANATWYYATLRGKQLRADDSHKDDYGRYQTNSTKERTDVYKWAFFGNPYDNFYVMNKEQGSEKYLYAGDVPVMQSATPASDNKARWAITPNTNGGFTMRSESGTTLYINDAGNDGNLGYWNSTYGANDGGSNWVVEDATTSDKNALAEAIAVAQVLVDNAGIPGYINTTVAATLDSGLTSAKAVYENASGDYASAYNTLATAIETAAVPANINYTPRTDVYYTIVNARGAMVYDSSKSSNVDATNDNAEYIWYGSTTPNATDPNNLWGFIESDGNYYMYNVGKKQFATVGTGTYGSTWIFSDTPAYITLDDGIADEIVPPGVRVRATIATTGNSYTMSVSPNYTGPVITYDGNGDGGVPMTFAVSSLAVDETITAEMMAKIENVTPYRNALKEVIDACASLNFGTAFGVYAENATYTNALAAANTAYSNASATKDELQTATINLQDAVAGLVLNTPAAGYYRVKNVATGKYLTITDPTTGYNNSETKGVFANGDGNSSATIIKLYDSGNGKLYMYNQGYGFGWVVAGAYSGNVWAQTPPDKYVHWFPGNVAGQIAFAICMGDGEGDFAAYLTRGIYTVDTEDSSVIGGWDYTANAAQWVFEKYTPVEGDINLDGEANTTDVSILVDIVLGKKKVDNYNANQSSYTLKDITTLVNKIKSASAQ